MVSHDTIFPVITAAGTILGAMGSTYLSNRLQARREQHTRDEARRTAQHDSVRLLQKEREKYRDLWQEERLKNVILEQRVKELLLHSPLLRP